jgi:hypothetical protein
LQFFYGEAGPTEHVACRFASSLIQCPTTQQSFRISHQLHLFDDKPREKGLPRPIFGHHQASPPDAALSKGSAEPKVAMAAVSFNQLTMARHLPSKEVN